MTKSFNGNSCENVEPAWENEGAGSTAKEDNSSATHNTKDNMDQDLYKSFGGIDPALCNDTNRFIIINPWQKIPCESEWSASTIEETEAYQKYLKDVEIECYTQKPTLANYRWDDPYLQNKSALGYNIGMLCTHMAVFDADNVARLTELGIMDKLPPTRKVITARGGTHMYYNVTGKGYKLVLYDPERGHEETNEKTGRTRFIFNHLGELQLGKFQVVCAGSTYRKTRDNLTKDEKEKVLKNPQWSNYKDCFEGPEMPYTLANDLPIATISFDDMLEIVKDLRLSKVREKGRSNDYTYDSDKERLVDQIGLKVEDLITDTSEFRYSGDEIQGPHPVHGSTNGFNFAFNPAKNTWFCYRCNSGGDAITLVAVLDGIIDCTQAVKWEDAEGKERNFWASEEGKKLFPKVLDAIRARGYIVPESKQDRTKKPMIALINDIEHLLNGEKEARLVFDSLGKPFLWVKMNEHFEMLELNEKSKAFKKFCFRLVEKMSGINLKDDETFKNALLAIEVKAEEITEKKGFDLYPLNLGYRRTWHNNAAWYDLCNEDWTGIQIDENGYRKVALPPIFLRRGSENPQVEPIYNAEPKEVDRLFKYSNIKSDDQKLLLKSWLCASFAPMFKGLKLPQPILSFSGVTGSGKTFLAKIMKKIIDPSEVDVKRLPKEVEDLAVMLNKNGMVVFDNIGNKIPQDISDTLCIAATKGFVTKRKLYSDDEEAILRLDSSVIFTSIQIEKMNDDLVNRTVFVETSKFSKNQKRKRELMLNVEFYEDLPYILGGVFASISEALKIYSTLDDIDTGEGELRMLDFAIFGEALSRVWGNKEMKFFSAYNEMQGLKTSEAIEENLTLNTFVSYMKEKGSYYGPLGDILTSLKSYCTGDTSYFVSNPTSFSKKLKEKDGSLAAMGIEVIPDEKKTDGKTFYRINCTRDDTQPKQSLIDDSKGW